MDLTIMFALCWIGGAALFLVMWFCTRRLRHWLRLAILTFVAAVALCPSIWAGGGSAGLYPLVVAFFVEPQAWRMHCVIFCVFFGVLLGCIWALQTLWGATRPLFRRQRQRPSRPTNGLHWTRR